MARPIPDSVLDTAFREALTEEDASLTELGERHGVSASLISKMRRRADQIRRDHPNWSPQAILKQLTNDGWITVRRSEYRLKRPYRTWRAWTVVSALTVAVFTVPVVRMVL